MPDDAIDSIMVSIMGITIWEALWNLCMSIRPYYGPAKACKHQFNMCITLIKLIYTDHVTNCNNWVLLRIVYIPVRSQV